MLHLYQCLLGILCLSAIWYNCYAIYAAIKFFSLTPQIDTDFHPPIAVLKPICGLDIETYENFASFCKQDYPEYQIIFSVRDERDPCVEVVKTIINDFPEVDICLVICDRTIGTNLKVSNLANAQAKAKYSLLLLADSDVRVQPNYLKRVIQPMKDPSVGVVTCLYRPQVRGWIAIFEAVGISTEYLAGVLVARFLEGMKFALGPTIAIRTTTLEKIGGFQAIADYLADDFQLGYLSDRAGYKVVLSDYIIDHTIATENLTDLVHRQTRWNCCTRVSRPWGYLGLIFTYGTAISLLLLIATYESIFSWIIWGIVLMTRLIMAWEIGVKSLKDPVAKKFLLLVPLRDLLSFGLWCYGFIGNTFEWRGRRLKLTRGGKLIPLAVDSTEAVST
jgi:ceramide glucosyltransferase